MATYRKRGKRWQAQIRITDQPPESRTFATRAEAKAWAEEREEELRTGTAARAGDATVGHVLKRYARDVSPGKRGGRWEVLRLAKLAGDPLAAVRLDQVGKADIADWRDRRLREVAPGTVLREWNLIRAALEAARNDWGLIRTNPMSDVRRPAAPKHRDRRVSEDEFERLRMALGWPADEAPATLSAEVAVMLALALETAMRAGELNGLRWSDVHLDQRYATLARSKNGDARSVPLSTRAVALLKLMPTDRATVFSVSPASRDALFRKARKRAEIDDMTFHDSRHEAITRLARKLDVLDLARMVGHRDPRSPMVYYNATAGEIAERLG